MRTFILLFIVIASIARQSVAQNRNTITIKGTAINVRDKTVVPYLPVFLKCNDSCYIATQTDTKGDFQFNLNSFKSLNLYAKPNKDVRTPTAPQGFFLPEKEIIIYKDSIKDKYILLIDPIPMGEIRLPSFLFKKNSLELVDSIISSTYYFDGLYSKSINELDSVYKMLLESPFLSFEFNGHCSLDEKNPEQLSLARAEKIKQLLIEKGVDKNRLTVNSWGVKKIKITAAQISKAKTQKEKEALNGLNRRVTIKISDWWYTATEEKPLCK